LLAKMTTEEKARQLVLDDAITVATYDGAFNETLAAAYLGGLGAGVLNWGRDVDPNLANAIQDAVVAASRHGIPALFAEECQHGVQGDHHTIFPSPPALAATFDVDLLRAVGAVVGAEARAGGTAQCWAPVCGLAREPRWGRGEEELGEDAYLAGELAGAMVRGMTADGRLDSPNATSLLKHFVAYSVPEAGRNEGPAHMGPRELRETYARPFAKAVAAGATGVMSSYNEVDGVPVSGDAGYLEDLLRGELGFEGYVSSDFGAIHNLQSLHYTAADGPEAVRQFLEAGGSVNGHDYHADYEAIVANLTDSGRMASETLDLAAGRVLAVKRRLGLLRDVGGVAATGAYRTDPALVATRLGDAPSHRAVAARAAAESVVLLANDRVLPLDADALAGKIVAVVGPNGDEARMGDYSAAGWSGGAPSGGGNIDTFNMSHSWNDGPAVALLWSLAEDDDDDELAKAKRLMDAADAVVAVVGGANNLRAPDGGNDSTEGEGVDRASLALTGRQRDLVDAALASASKSGAPLAVVLVDGKPTAEPLLKTAPAVLAAFNGGQAQGDAIAAVLVGAANPSGRLPLSFPASADVLPVFYDRKPSSARSGWCDVAESVLWAFGHGLSYSNVTYADVSVVPETASAATDEVLVRFTLAHAGGPPVVEVPQVYVRDVVSSVTTPLRSLKAFARVDLAPGETRRVELAISLDELRVLDRTMAWVLEPGTFEVYVGPASDDTPLSASFDV
ncbi:hypothetical protein AURANDRAFT_539, partial [Aureococcus anophagefferens]